MQSVTKRVGIVQEEGSGEFHTELMEMGWVQKVPGNNYRWVRQIEVRVTVLWSRTLSGGCSSRGIDLAYDKLTGFLYLYDSKEVGKKDFRGKYKDTIVKNKQHEVELITATMSCEGEFNDNFPKGNLYSPCAYATCLDIVAPKEGIWTSDLSWGSQGNLLMSTLHLNDNITRRQSQLDTSVASGVSYVPTYLLPACEVGLEIRLRVEIADGSMILKKRKIRKVTQMSFYTTAQFETGQEHPHNLSGITLRSSTSNEFGKSC